MSLHFQSSHYFVILLALSTLAAPASAEVLQGEVERQDEQLRLARPNNSPPGAGDDLRIERPPPLAPQRPLNGLVNTQAFSAPLQANAQANGGSLGLVAPGQFGSIPNSRFDLGAERESKELVLAWEKWHRQLSQAIYARWSDTASVPGSCTLKLTVTRDRNIQVIVVRPSGNPAFDQGLLDAIYSLNGNPGLSFPSQSQRQFVSVESDYVAGHNIAPGYSWVKNDYERVREDR